MEGAMAGIMEPGAAYDGIIEPYGIWLYWLCIWLWNLLSCTRQHTSPHGPSIGCGTSTALMQLTELEHERKRRERRSREANQRRRSQTPEEGRTRRRCSLSS